jgi:hypothetical protein
MIRRDGPSQYYDADAIIAGPMQPFGYVYKALTPGDTNCTAMMRARGRTY